MKRLSVLTICIAIAVAMFYLPSCKKKETYSCDEGLNNYATMNLVVNQTITRDDLAQMGLDTQFAIFNSLSAENKLRIFKEKLNYLLQEQSIPDTEKEHINDLLTNITPAVYDTTDNAVTAYVISWKVKAIEVLHWDELKVFEYAETWLTPTEFAAMTDNEFGGGSGVKCLCASNLACAFGMASCNKNSGCEETKTGCGLMGKAPCKGRCKY